MIDSRRVRHVLGLYGTIQWSRISIGRDIIDDLWRPPLVVWRYIQPTDVARERLHSLVECFDGSVGWFSDFTEKNWVIVPRILHAVFEGAREGDTAVMADFKRLKQGFCAKATLDLERMLNEIERAAVGI